VFRFNAEHNGLVPETSTEEAATAATKEVSSTMSIVKRVRERRQMHRRNRAIDRAMQAAPTQAMRDEIVILAQRQPF